MDQQNQNNKPNGEGFTPEADHHKTQQPQSAQLPAAPRPAQSNKGQGQNQGAQTTGSQPKSACCQSSHKPDAMDVLKQTPVPPVLCDWLVCLRKPALSMQYSIQKRHVPDLDTDKQTADGTATAKGGTAPREKGVNSDTMAVQGDFTIRYFDLAAGVLALAAVGCLIKTCCCLKRKIF